MRVELPLNDTLLVKIKNMIFILRSKLGINANNICLQKLLIGLFLLCFLLVEEGGIAPVNVELLYR